MRVVVFAPSPLLLTNVKRDTEGNLISGYVINGDWNFGVRDGHGIVIGGVHRWKLPIPLESVDVPNTMWDDYNSIINWAENELRVKPK